MSDALVPTTDRDAESSNETARLLKEATTAVDALCVHLNKTGDEARTFKANRALRALWELE